MIEGMRHERLIRRKDENYFHGWVVAFKRGDLRESRYFSDQPHGRAESLRQAKAFRDRREQQLPPPTKLKRTYVLNTTGVVGVSLSNNRTRKGTLIARYIARFPRPDGSDGKASYSVHKYGKAGAFRLAVAARRKAIGAFKRAKRAEPF